jgi:hypothetical protein
MLAAMIDLIFWFLALVLLSFFLDRLWAISLARFIYIIFAAPGIIVHEFSHYLACKITGAYVTKVKWISFEGGSVTHGPPKRGGVIGQSFISMAPFIGIPLFLILIGLVFDRVEFFNCTLTWSHDQSWNVGDMLIGTFRSAFDLIKVNIIDNRSPWFVFYLYLAASFTTALAPSKQDFKNGWVGLLVLSILIIAWSLLNDLLLKDLGWEAPVTYFLIDLMGWVVAIGLILCMFGLLLALPFYILKKVLKR